MLGHLGPQYACGIAQGVGDGEHGDSQRRVLDLSFRRGESLLLLSKGLGPEAHVPATTVVLCVPEGSG